MTTIGNAEQRHQHDEENIKQVKPDKGGLSHSSLDD